MSANLAEVTVTGSSFPNVFAFPVSQNIGGVPVQVSIEETHDDILEVTEHPVETGAAITDHSYSKPSELLLRCGWSNSSIDALSAIVSGYTAGSVMSVHDYVSGVYSQLLNLQQSRALLTIQTGLRAYKNMLITSLRVQRDKTTSQALMVVATCKQVILVNSVSTTLPPQANMAQPQNTAEVVQGGSAQLRPGATPAPGGSVPIPTGS
jgi:hypothetical protein